MSTPIDNYNPNLEEEDAQIELCDYVFQIADYREDGEFHPYRFWYRYCTGAIDYPFTKERFLKNDDIIATLEGFGLDVEKFWLAVVFIFDWTISKFHDCLSVKTPLDSLQEI